MEISILEAICRNRQQGLKAALVTIIDTRGSTPRKAGSKMLVQPDGRITGTIGGGCAEAEVRLQALHAIDAGQSFVYQVNMLNDAAADEGMVCGGVMEVFIQVV
ncbi:XdhC family protein|uniref:Predicted sulfurylase small subunit, molybdopterin cytosine dinucleotide biosynthesis n=1 Tax=Dendrosporobacter quercicolus TaxID=146817 RepID=A0A1H0A074_9FIRM|nr:XdhC family protein [Dendrosporobacter quercicolus]NSL50084.1 XdhC family protein [Dendrosporobacter quercicolus DSM 1736]SDN26541.1 predicted sulfurylase small subunit, molybdopterin cytosine dinucleotide biosynthesis [Dendrosporobacter quercicolus]